MIVPIIAKNMNPVPFPAKNGKGRKFFLVNLFLSGSIAKKRHSGYHGYHEEQMPHLETSRNKT